MVTLEQLERIQSRRAEAVLTWFAALKASFGWSVPEKPAGFPAHLCMEQILIAPYVLRNGERVWEHSPFSEAAPGEQLHEILRQWSAGAKSGRLHRLVVIQGAAGTGKSVLLQMTAVIIADFLAEELAGHRRSVDDIPIPVLFAYETVEAAPIGEQSVAEAVRATLGVVKAQLRGHTGHRPAWLTPAQFELLKQLQTDDNAVSRIAQMTAGLPTVNLIDDVPVTGSKTSRLLSSAWLTFAASNESLPERHFGDGRALEMLTFHTCLWNRNSFEGYVEKCFLVDRTHEDRQAAVRAIEHYLHARPAATVSALAAAEYAKGRLQNAVSHAPEPPPKKPGAAIPNNLPRPQPFFGREAELKKIADALSPTARGWGVLIDGPGGMGKTALAVRAAELVPAGRFQRIIFLSSKERELTADGQRALGHFVLPGYLEMLNAIAGQLHQSELTRLPGAERTAAILTALGETEVLLLLDNLETLPEGDRDQLFAFLGHLPPGCAAIVTSRRRSDAQAVVIRLDQLDWPAARGLLAELAENNGHLAAATEAERRALYAAAGGNPLLMRWISGQLGNGRCRTIAAALDFLRAAPVGNNPLEFIFGDLLETFTPTEIKVLAALVHFKMPMAVKFIAELADLHEDAAQGALGDLASRSLVLPDVEGRLFLLVPTVADFLLRKRPEAVEKTVEEAVTEAVTESGRRLEARAYALIEANSSARYDRIQVLEAAWPTVAPALPFFLAGPNPRLQAVCAALRDFLDFSGRWDEWLSLSEQAEARAVAAGDDETAAGLRAADAGWIYYSRGQAAEVRACADRAEAHWAQAGAHARSIPIRLRGLAYQLEGEYQKAIEKFREVLALLRGEATESGDMANVLNDLATAERLMGDLAAAERDCREAVRMARGVDDAEGVALYTGNLAEVALDREDWPGAEAQAREALSLSEGVGRPELIAEDCRRLAEILARQGKVDEGLPAAERAVALFTLLGSPSLAAAQTTLRELQRLIFLRNQRSG
ncbi:MAG TPA: tetratricopeptide repeat protein [Chthoniobacteraceae bacterium]|jgi:tetratricopeptide (TPR) repeat protein|nr:tetratricopeptide repeat protein [Chthoniobacteraceae bacterium]